LVRKQKIIGFILILLFVTLSCQTAQGLIEGGLDSGQASATSTPLPTITPPLIPTEPEPTIIEVPAAPTLIPGLLFIDEFTDRSSGWPVETTESSVIDYVQDGYHIAVNTSDSLAWSVVGPTLGNVRILVDASLIGGGEDNYLGAICRYQDANNFYMGVITSDGFYAILRRFQGGSFEFLSSDRWEDSIVINQHMEMNLIELACIDNQISLTVNGQLLSQVEDTGILLGDVGLIVGTITADSTDVLFDNFTLYLEE
jgi:hypothetical protein